MASRQVVNPTIVDWFSGHEGYRCGYCKKENTNFSHGMWAHALTVEDYQDLIDRGWRRSGKYCYKPTMNVTCCPHYTIRCDVTQFKLSNSQKKVLKKVNKFLIKGDKSGSKKDMETEGSTFSSEGTTSLTTETDVPTQDTSKTKASGKMTQSSCMEQKKHVPKKGTGADPNKPVCKKAKDIRKERKLQKMAEKSKPAEKQSASPCNKPVSKPNQPKSLEDFLDEPTKVENPAHRLEIKTYRSSLQSQDYKEYIEDSHSVYHKYQTTIHNDPPDKPNLKQFTRFLVDSPLQLKKSEKLPNGYGSFHQHYLLDGKLIAVGVLDILPHCVSSVYLYYDPDYNFLSLGTYAALQELSFTRKLHQLEPQMNFYYMGYYIHTCAKMRYKGQYYPSYLLCPETYTWQPIEICVPKLDQNNYSRLDEDPKKGDECGKINIDQVLVLHAGSMLTYKQYRQVKKDANDREDVLQYAGFVGKNCSQRMLLYRQ